MPRKPRANGFDNDAAEQIWCDSIGNNAFVRHRDQCATCLEVYLTPRGMDQPGAWCSEGDRIFNEMMDEVFAKIDEVRVNQN